MHVFQGKPGWGGLKRDTKRQTVLGSPCKQTQLVSLRIFFHLLKNVLDFPLLVLQGIYHYWKYVRTDSSGLKQMEVFRPEQTCSELQPAASQAMLGTKVKGALGGESCGFEISRVAGNGFSGRVCVKKAHN